MAKVGPSHVGVLSRQRRGMNYNLDPQLHKVVRIFKHMTKFWTKKGLKRRTTCTIDSLAIKSKPAASATMQEKIKLTLIA